MFMFTLMHGSHARETAYMSSSIIIILIIHLLVFWNSKQTDRVTITSWNSIAMWTLCLTIVIRQELRCGRGSAAAAAATAAALCHYCRVISGAWLLLYFIPRHGHPKSLLWHWILAVHSPGIDHCVKCKTHLILIKLLLLSSLPFLRHVRMIDWEGGNQLGPNDMWHSAWTSLLLLAGSCLS